MARLRNHKDHGQSVNCKTLTPFEKGEGPTFTAHIFDTKAQNGDNKVCAFELWQRNADKAGTRLLVLEGTFEAADPASDEAMLNLIRHISTLDATEATKDYYENHAVLVLREAELRFTPRPSRQKKTPAAQSAQAAEVSSEPAPTAEPVTEISFDIQIEANVV